MNVTIIITNYNYGKFLYEALDSLRAQSYPGMQIILVDDGSTDNSVELINMHKYNEFISKLVKKQNKGQLSCFNAALPYIEGDIVFFLDADDVYSSDYIEKALGFYKQNPKCDFLFCDRVFIDENGKKINKNNTKRIFPLKCEFGYTPIAAYMTNQWIGAATSCISMKTSLLKKILPIPYESEWITRADDCLVWGASLKLGYKCFLNEPLVQYRIHGNNYHHGKSIDIDRLYHRSVAINKLFSFLTKEYDTYQLQYLIAQEFSSLPEKKGEDLKIYLRALAKSNINNVMKARQALSIFKNYLVR